jgi:hypothetical protein
MATDDATIPIDRESPETVQSTVSTIKTMLKVGAVFVAVGYVLIIGALVLEFTQFHPAIESFFSTYPNLSLAGGGPERSAAASSQLATIHTFPSTLLWMKLGGVGHILVGIFVALAAIVRALALMPHRLSYEMERTQD